MGIEYKDLGRFYTQESIEDAEEQLTRAYRKKPSANAISALIEDQVYPGQGFAKEVWWKTGKGGSRTEAELLSHQLDEQGTTSFRFRHEVGNADEFLRRANEAVRAGDPGTARYWYQEYDSAIDQAH